MDAWVKSETEPETRFHPKPWPAMDYIDLKSYGFHNSVPRKIRR
jgi:hypothetical protein